MNCLVYDWVAVLQFLKILCCQILARDGSIRYGVIVLGNWDSFRECVLCVSVRRVSVLFKLPARRACDGTAMVENLGYGGNFLDTICQMTESIYLLCCCCCCWELAVWSRWFSEIFSVYRWWLLWQIFRNWRSMWCRVVMWYRYWTAENVVNRYSLRYVLYCKLSCWAF